MRVLALASVLVVAFCQNVWAWGDEGRKVVCEITYRLAMPTTKTVIDRLIAADTEFTTYSDSRIWPDHPKKRSVEHYLDLPRRWDRRR